MKTILENVLYLLDGINNSLDLPEKIVGNRDNLKIMKRECEMYLSGDCTLTDMKLSYRYISIA